MSHNVIQKMTWDCLLCFKRGGFAFNSPENLCGELTKAVKAGPPGRALMVQPCPAELQ